MDSNTLRDKVRKMVAINRAISRSKMFDKNRSIDEELPELKMEKKAHQKAHYYQQRVDSKEEREKDNLRAKLIQEMSVGEQTVEFGFRSETFKAPSNLNMHY
ncbi:uncharacterized protein [Drosophila bipectinata]|uniref:uncharacterized protein n=1 Tax=Drosophila bipectinata TaxID=42026 RepID=UPI0038B36DDD